MVVQQVPSPWHSYRAPGRIKRGAGTAGGCHSRTGYVTRDSRETRADQGDPAHETGCVGPKCHADEDRPHARRRVVRLGARATR